MPTGRCDLCTELRDRAVSAVTRHARLIGKSAIARFKYDSEAALALEQPVEQASTERDNAMAAYHQHQRQSHADAAGANKVTLKMGGSI